MNLGFALRVYSAHVEVISTDSRHFRLKSLIFDVEHAVT
jgi:hypothetical protein